MATTTQNLALIKPAGTDKIRIAQINSNMDIIDTKMGAVGNTSLQTQINNTTSKVDGAVSCKELGDFYSISDLNSLLNNELATMSNNTWRVISARAMATFDIFVNTYRYYGTLYRGGSTSWAHVELHSNAQPEMIIGEIQAQSTSTWRYRMLASTNYVETALSSALNGSIGNLQVYTKTIPANGGTATIRVSATMPCLIFTSLSSTSTTFSGHYASILATGAPAYMPLFTAGSKVAFSADAGGGLTVTNNHTAGISLIMIRLMGEATVTITTASA